jgi:hypothetical protein
MVFAELHKLPVHVAVEVKRKLMKLCLHCKNAQMPFPGKLPRGVSSRVPRSVEVPQASINST